MTVVCCTYVNVDTDEPVDVVIVCDLLQLLKFIFFVVCHDFFEGEVLEVEDIWKFKPSIDFVIL